MDQKYIYYSICPTFLDFLSLLQRRNSILQRRLEGYFIFLLLHYSVVVKDIKIHLSFAYFFCFNRNV